MSPVTQKSISILITTISPKLYERIQLLQLMHKKNLWPHKISKWYKNLKIKHIHSLKKLRFHLLFHEHRSKLIRLLVNIVLHIGCMKQLKLWMFWFASLWEPTHLKDKSVAWVEPVLGDPKKFFEKAPLLLKKKLW